MNESTVQPMYEGWADDAKTQKIALYPGNTLAITVDNYTMQCTLQKWQDVCRESLNHEFVVSALERQVNAREPNKFLPELIEELAKLEKAARKLATTEGAGHVMLGQAQGIRDAIEAIKAKLPDLDPYRRF